MNPKGESERSTLMSVVAALVAVMARLCQQPIKSDERT